MPDVIVSAANPLIKRIRMLADRRHRQREEAFVVRGIQPVWQAVEAGSDIETLVVAPALLRDPAARMVAEQERRGVRVARLSAELFARIADRDGPSGLAAIVRARPVRLSDLAVSADSFFVALHEVGNPGNLGTIIRTADAVGASGVILVSACTDPFDAVAVKASMGAIFSVPVTSRTGADEFLDWRERNKLALIVTSPAGTGSLWDTPLPVPGVVLLGSEGRGLPSSLLDAGDVRLQIPMTGTAESLNLAVAAGVVLYEARRRHWPGDGRQVRQ